MNRFLIVFWRNLKKDKVFSFINIFGLSIGIASCLAIYLFAHYHLTYDKFNKDYYSIYRVLTIDKALGVASNNVGITFPAAGPEAKENLPEITSFCRFAPQGNTLLQFGETQVTSENFAYADSSFFNFFDYQLLQGNKKEVLLEPNSIVITNSFSKKLFGNENPIDKQVEDQSGNLFKVTGVAEDPPAQSHITFDVLLSSVPTANDSNSINFLTSWGIVAVPTYIKIHENADINEVEAKLVELARNNDVPDNFSLTTQPLAKVHLESTETLFDNHNQGKSDLSQIKNMLWVAFFILLVAAFNFMNLSTTKSLKSAKEIGVKKILGAQKSKLILQQILTSIFYALISLIIGLMLLTLLGEKTGLSIQTPFIKYWLSNSSLIFYTLLFTISVGAISGIYPALFLTNVNPLKTIKGKFQNSKAGNYVKKSLVVVQFSISVIAIIGMLIVWQQLNFMTTKDMGFNKDYVVNTTLNTPSLAQGAQAFENEILKINSVEGIAYSSGMPGAGYGRTGLNPEGHSSEEQWIFSATSVSTNFLEVLKLKLVEGRFFSDEFESDPQQSIIINQAAAEVLEWDNPIGKNISFGQGQRTVIGVIKNFHYVGLRHPIEPLLLFPRNQKNGAVSIKLKSDNIENALAEIESVWQNVYPNQPFNYTFFDDTFKQLFTDDLRFGKILMSFNWLTILIACLGLLGLTAFSVQQRMREIGIRKVLGASIFDLLNLLSKEFLLLLVLANIIGIPIAYYLVKGWLAEFVYRTDLNPIPFSIALIASILIALITIFTQAIRASKINPITVISTE